MNILVTGGAGYIGSHVVVELIQKGCNVIIVDNFSNSKPFSLEGIAKITNKTPSVYHLDVRNTDGLQRVFEREQPRAVVHCAALKSVSESNVAPLPYFDNNISGTISLLIAMKKTCTRNLIFSSSATVYGDQSVSPIKEDAPLQVTNPYGRTKLVMEQLIGDVTRSDKDFGVAILRYFNPVGAHQSGLIGESPSGVPGNLMPYICRVAAKKLPILNIFGSDYTTIDGTGVRDYLHIVDLARAHVKALDVLLDRKSSFTVNVGTGRGYSVLEVLHTFERVNQCEVPYCVVERRPGDVDECYADPKLASSLLGWKADFGLEKMCRDAWRWQLGKEGEYANK